MTFPLLRQKGRKSCSNKSNGWALQLVAVLCVATFWIQRVLDKYCYLSLMMCHEVTGNLAEKISFLEYEARLAMMCFSIEVQLSPPPDPIPHRALSSPLPILCLPAGQEAEWAVLFGQVTHVCWLPGTGPRAGMSAGSALSLSLSRDMNWGLCPAQWKAGLPILEKLNFYPRNSISLIALYPQYGVIQKLIGRDQQLRHMTGNMMT